MGYGKKPKNLDGCGLNILQLAYSLGRVQGVLSVFGPHCPEIEWLRSRGVTDEVIASMRLNLDILADSLDARVPGPGIEYDLRDSGEQMSWSELVSTVFPVNK